MNILIKWLAIANATARSERHTKCVINIFRYVVGTRINIRDVTYSVTLSLTNRHYDLLDYVNYFL